jgi:hypothetical protein
LKYIDRNHGGTLIVWDRPFGTYQAEEEEPAYGITKPLASWNPVWANFHSWAELLASARRTRRLSDKIWIFLKPLYAQGRVPFPVLLAGAGFVLLSLVALSALIERRPWAPALEAARLLAALLAAATFSWC